MADESQDIFESTEPASWTVGSVTTFFPVHRITETGGNRIVRRPRPYRDGAKLDDTGSKEKSFTVEAVFDNSIEEPGLSDEIPLYPDALNRLIDSFDKHETGTLNLPSRSGIRCRAESYQRTEDAGQRDQAALSMTFVADNEDNVDATSFQQPSARASARKLAEDTTFSADSNGIHSLDDLVNAAADVEDAIAAPGEFIQDVDQKAQRAVRILTNLEQQNSVTLQFGRDRLSDPESWGTVRQIHILQDRLATAMAEKASSLPRLVARRFPTTRSIFDIAAELNQDAKALIDVNPNLENVMVIEAGTVVYVFES